MNGIQAPIGPLAPFGRGPGMSVLLASPGSIEYACECCARLLTPPPLRMRLRLRDRVRVFGMALGRMLFHFKGLMSSYRTIRPRLLAHRNEQAFEAFVTSFRFCHRCRGFICPRCWNGRRKMCRGCVAVARLRLPERRLFLSGAEPGGQMSGRRHRPSFGLGALLRPGRVRTATSLAVLAMSLLLGAAEVACVIAAPIH